ncbi:MAG: HAMP domain-containing histidine kinase, partial [Bacteroidetes bacterium]|nr:HAMP domain-containing histidine kinase [Bacteroidota bacterium]
INLVFQSAQNTHNLLEDILIWARAKSDKLPFQPEEIEFSILLKNVLSSLNLAAKNKNISINIAADGKLRVFADVNMLKTILRNLISNAIKFTNLGGKINIWAIQKNTEIIVAISDNGIGIEEKIVKKLFEISQTHSIKGTANETGTGLGLFLCKDFVEKHGGKIWIESEIGKGSNFRFSLPL